MEFGGQKVTLKHLENLTKLIGQTFINSYAKFNTKQMQIPLFNLRKTTHCIHTSRNTYNRLCKYRTKWARKLRGRLDTSVKIYTAQEITDAFPNKQNWGMGNIIDLLAKKLMQAFSETKSFANFESYHIFHLNNRPNWRH